MSKETTQQPDPSGDSPTLGDLAAGAAGSPAEDAPVSAEALQHALDEALARCDEHAEAALRARAELENVRKRSEREVANARKYGLERFVQELLPVKDSMEMGLAAATEEGADVAKLREGTELTLRMLASATEKFGVTEVNPLGESFDPERHQAISTVDSDQAESGVVTTVVQKGYLLQDRLVRPALVIVAK
jgi:molecular chaperone GrpE